MPGTHLRLSQDAGVATVVLDRQEARNAFDEAMIDEIAAAFKALSKDGSLRAVVVRGDGKDFSAGADIAMMRRAGGYKPAQNKREAMRLVGMCRAIDECPVPVLSRVHGACFGGALGIVAASDIAVAAEEATMSFSECRLGILPAVISNFVLPKIGPAYARRYFLTAEVFGASAAKDMGLVHETVPEAMLDERVAKIVKSILRAGPNAVRECKALIRKVHGLPLERRIKATTDALARVRAGEEAKEGLTAFLEKRPASWIVPDS
ncbi:MAG: enoyl-CoA hydratase/isomerase family protein [Elusimicrobia bacterium]|nr:enoyl-CoA hydratase/isomerase family protein [Elusimicrobiota bacterium]